MKESAPDPRRPCGGCRPATGAWTVKDPDGFVYIPPRNRMVVGWANGLTRWAGNNVPVDWFGRAVKLTDWPADQLTPPG